MKKLFLSAFVDYFALLLLAQFMAVTTYDNDQEETADKITANMGIGYMVNDAFTVGLKKEVIMHTKGMTVLMTKTLMTYGFVTTYLLTLMVVI